MELPQRHGTLTEEHAGSPMPGGWEIRTRCRWLRADHPVRRGNECASPNVCPLGFPGCEVAVDKIVMEPPAGISPGSGAGDLLEGAGLLAATANVIMQLARPEVGYGVLESEVHRAQIMRHPLRRWRVTVTYLAAALMGNDVEREACRRAVNRSHAQVHSAPHSPARYSAFDPQLQLWIAACLHRGMIDTYALLRGPADDQTAEAIHRAARRFGTTLQMPARLWPSDRAAFDSYWDSALAAIRIDPPVRAYLHQLIMLGYLPRPLSAALGPLNRFLTTGFLPPPFREQMQLPWTDSDQRQFESLMHVIATINRLLPGPARRFPFNACLLGLRARIGWDRACRSAVLRRHDPGRQPGVQAA